MRRLFPLVCALLLVSLGHSQANDPAAPKPLPVRKVVLYKTGIGYFEHVGKVRGDQEFTVDFTTSQLNDVLKSLTIVDNGGGTVEAVRYNSVAPVAERLRTLRLALGEHATAADLLAALRGTRVEVQSGRGAATGTVLAVERKTQLDNRGSTITVEELSILTANGQLRRFTLTPDVVVRVADPELGRELSRYLSVVGSARARDFRRMTISTRGAGQRELSLSYISEVPVWKSTYRLVMEGKKATLQGWGIVDNTIGEDWNNVKLSLVAGTPQSFVQDISQPYYVRRPVVEAPDEVSLEPQAHAGTMEMAATIPFTGGVMVRTSLHGIVTDPQGAVLSRARVTLRDATSGQAQTTMTDDRGYYSFPSAPVGNVQVEVDAPGFQKSTFSNVFLSAGVPNEISVPLRIGAGTDTVEVRAGAPLIETSTSMISSVVVKTDAARRGDVFEYAIKTPVTISKNQSALVPVLQNEVEVERVTLWNLEEQQPRRAVWLKNDTGLTLDGGTFEVLDEDTFAGEGVMATIHPGERRLLSYAADKALSVVALGERPNDRGDDDDEEDGASWVATRIRIARGDIHITREEKATMTYTIHNADLTPRTVVIEHPLRGGWRLDPEAKPEEISTEAYRFKETVEPGATKKLVVVSTRPKEETIAVGELTSESLALLVQGRTLSPGLLAGVRDLVTRKENIKAVDAEMQARNKEMEGIHTDQARLRENMKALRGTGEERTLLQRYIRQLNEQEDRIAALRSELATLKTRRDQLQNELNAALERFTIDEQL